MRLNVFINRVLDWPANKFEKLQRWLDDGRKINDPRPHPFTKRCFLVSEAPRGGHRIIIGFDNLEDMQEAYSVIDKIRQIEAPPNALGQEPCAAVCARSPAPLGSASAGPEKGD